MPIKVFLCGLLLILGGLLTSSCSSSPGNLERFGAAKELPGCKLTLRKCSRCHEPERIFSYKPSTPRFWQSVVNRMRRKGGSNISPEAGDAITECLVVRSFGHDGLDSLKRGTSADDNQQ